MLHEILITNRPDLFGYNKICAIKTEGWQWGSGERDTTNYDIIIFFITDEEINETLNLNKWCFDANHIYLIETPKEYQRKPECE